MVAATEGELLEVKLHGFYGADVEVNNIFHYRVDGVGLGASLAQFGAGFYHGVVSGNLRGITVAAVVYDRIEVSKLNLDGALGAGEPYIIPVGSGDGLDTGEAMPPHDCYTYKYIPNEAHTRLGFKRFAGVNEDRQVGGFPTGGSMTALNNLALALELPQPAWTVGEDGLPDAGIVGTSMSPVILHRVFAGDILDEVEVNDVQGVVFDKIGTQNTRKFGRGS